MSLKKFVLPEYSQDLLTDLMQNNAFDSFYLAGGTALALQIGHRESIDLDFFTSQDFKSNLVSNIRESYQTISLHDNSIELFIRDTKVMFFYFGFELYEALKVVDGIRLASPIDIGLMKLLALQGRTSRKDIIDLYYIDKEIIKLSELIKLFNSHYPKDKFNSYQSLKVLMNYEELRNQPMPKVYDDLDWKVCYGKVKKEIETFVLGNVNYSD